MGNPGVGSEPPGIQGRDKGPSPSIPKIPPGMDEEQLVEDLKDLRDRNLFQQNQRPFLCIYLLLGLSFLLLLIFFSVSLSRVSAISSKLEQGHTEQRPNFSNTDSLLFPCGPRSREWEYFGGKCYYFSLAKLSWPKAKAQCEELHSRLAVINNLAEQNFLMARTRNERFWIGLSDSNSEGEWEWIDGTDYRTSFTFWKEGEPNDSGSGEDCAHLWLSGLWNDVSCSYECYYLCERGLPR